MCLSVLQVCEGTFCLSTCSLFISDVSVSYFKTNFWNYLFWLVYPHLFFLSSIILQNFLF